MLLAYFSPLYAAPASLFHLIKLWHNERCIALLHTSCMCPCFLCCPRTMTGPSSSIVIQTSTWAKRPIMACGQCMYAMHIMHTRLVDDQVCSTLGGLIAGVVVAARGAAPLWGRQDGVCEKRGVVAADAGRSFWWASALVVRATACSVTARAPDSAYSALRWRLASRCSHHTMQLGLHGVRLRRYVCNCVDTQAEGLP